MDENLRDLLLQTGPLGTLVIVLGGLIRTWLARIEAELKSLATRDGVLDGQVRDIGVDIKDHERRIATLERTTVVRPTVRRDDSR